MSSPSDVAFAAPAGEAFQWPAGSAPKLVCTRGQKPGVEYPVYEGTNFVGRSDEQPVDIDLDDQEPQDRIWSSRQHSLITFQDGVMTVEDMNSSNGTYVNRVRLQAGTKQPIKPEDTIQIGAVHLIIKG